MAAENYFVDQSSMKVCGRAEIDLTTPWSAVRRAANCAIGPGGEVSETWLLIVSWELAEK